MTLKWIHDLMRFHLERGKTLFDTLTMKKVFFCKNSAPWFIVYTVRKNTRYSKRKLEWKNVAKLSNIMLKGCQITKKIKSFPDRILQKSTRSSQEQNGCERSKLNQIEKPTPLWKTNFLRCTTLPFNPKLYVNSEGGNKHFVFFQLR